MKKERISRKAVTVGCALASALAVVIIVVQLAVRSPVGFQVPGKSRNRTSLTMSALSKLF